jgi:hypothetical protein
VEVISPWAFRIKLPHQLHIRNVQPISHLEMTADNPLPLQQHEPPPPVMVKGEEEYEVERIEDSSIFRRHLQYLVKWKGYDEMNWEPAVNVDRLKAIDEFHKPQPGKPGSKASWVLSIRKGEATATVVSSEDRGKNQDRWKSYKNYKVHGRNQVSLEGIRSRWKESGFVGKNQVSLVTLRI